MNVVYVIDLAKNIYATYGIKRLIKQILAYGFDFFLDHKYSSLKIQDNLILFSSVPDFSDNARVLFDYMIKSRLNEKYQFVWAVTDTKKYANINIKNVIFIDRYGIFPERGKKRFYEYGRTAKWIFHTHGHPFENGGRPEQTIVNLWHGGMGFKLNKGIERKSGMNSDYVLISGLGDICVSVAKKFHLCSKEQILPIGLPRNDLLFKHTSIPLLNLTSQKKILWMPTFRASNNPAISDNTLKNETVFPITETEEQLHAFDQYLVKKEIHLYIKIHPFQSINTITKSKFINIHILTNPDIEAAQIQLYEVLNHFDALISDYSSVSFDYLCLDRPLAYTLDDYDKYNSSRGFVMENPLNYMPGHHVYTYSDLIKFIDDIATNNDQYVSERKRVKMLVGLVEDGNSCQKLIDYFGIN